jgi:hypothetical protein
MIEPGNESVAECCQTLGGTSGYAKLFGHSRLVEVLNVAKDIAIQHCSEKMTNNSQKRKGRC